MTSETEANWWKNEEAFATTLLVVATNRFPADFLTWDPETIRLEIEDDFNIVPAPSAYNKLMAAVTLMTTDKFYKSLPDFIMLCNVLSHGTFDPRTWDPADAMEIAWGITEALLIWPPDPNDESPFSDTILAYIGHAIRDEGIMVPPDVLRLGLREDTDALKKVQGEYSDDPTMFNAIYDMEHEKTDEINNEIKRRLRQLMQQLDSLQPEGTSASSIIKKMLAQLRAQAQGNSALPSDNSA